MHNDQNYLIDKPVIFSGSNKLSSMVPNGNAPSLYISFTLMSLKPTVFEQIKFWDFKKRYERNIEIDHT